MTKSILLKTETQTENKVVLSLCYINENLISLETSEIARIMFKLNRPLFDRINSSTKILGGAIFREEVVKAKDSVNRLGSKIFDSYEYSDKEISRLIFSDNILKAQQRNRTITGKEFDFDPKMVKDESGKQIFDADSPTRDDIENSTLVSSVEELDIFMDSGVKTILISDDLSLNESLFEVGYRIELAVDTNFKDYVNYVIKELEKSAAFLLKYSGNIRSPLSYDAKRLEFKKDFSDRILNALDLVGISDLSSNTVKTSEFGQVATTIYNASLLLGEVDKSIYGDSLRAMLPTSKTSPDNIIRFVNDFSILEANVKKIYLMSKDYKKKEKVRSRASSNKKSQNNITASSIERITIDRDSLGYSLFSDKQTGLNRYTIGDYMGRANLERSKHYPDLSAEDETGFLTNKEKSDFSSLNNASAFLTPRVLIMGDERISTDRGMKNIPINKIREFRIAKSARAQQMGAFKVPSGVSKGVVSKEVMSTFNVEVSAPKVTLLKRAIVEVVDPLVDSKNYLGEDSFFTVTDPIYIAKNFKRIAESENKRVLSIVSDVIPRRFLRKKGAIDSIKDLQLTNPHSKIRALVSQSKIDLRNIPPHVKFMMSKKFNPNSKSDPLKNHESRELIEETQKNIFLIQALVGFDLDSNGFLDVFKPIYKQMDGNMLTPGKSVLAKGVNYEIPELGITKDKFEATIYNNLIYIRG
tara:strand:+ start:1638 stop:3731 length:2094 start_codon:yes stop_codon:yes gene_type:complete